MSGPVPPGSDEKDSRGEAQSNKTGKKKGPSHDESYAKTRGGKLKLKGVDSLSKKKKKTAPPQQKIQKSATELLNERSRKKSDRYAFIHVGINEDD